MQNYGLPCDWQISVPDHWTGEYDEDSRQWVFYPDDSDLTIRITPFHAERDGVLVPVEVMEAAYINTIPASAIALDTSRYGLDGFSLKIYEDTVVEGNETVYVIQVGYYAMGELLSVNIYSTNKDECEQALEILKTIKR